MPDISYEALAGAALVIVLAVGYQYIPKADADAAGPGASGKSKKKNKKKVKGSKLEEVESGSASETSKKMEEAKTKAKKGKGERSNTSIPPAPAPIAAEPEAPSSAEVTSDGTEQTKEEKAKPKTLAQKIAPKNRKSKVDDMLAPDDRPAEHARVMKVASKEPTAPTLAPALPAAATPKETRPSEKIAKYEEDYLEGDDTTSGSGTIEDDGWDVVPSKKKKAFSISNLSPAGSSTTTPLPVDTKIQRKNAKKAEEKKALKDAEEADRLKRLSQHKKSLEKERIAEIYKKNRSASGKTNGGAFASLDTNGKLVWD